MITASQEIRAEVQGRLDVLMEIRARGDFESFDMMTWHCGTAACVEGSYQVKLGNFDLLRMYDDDNDSLSDHYMAFRAKCVESSSKLINGVFPKRIFLKKADYTQWGLFFGARNGSGEKALNKQIARFRWLLGRIDAMLEYERIRAMPRKERRALRLAA